MMTEGEAFRKLVANVRQLEDTKLLKNVPVPTKKPATFWDTILFEDIHPQETYDFRNFWGKIKVCQISTSNTEEVKSMTKLMIHLFLTKKNISRLLRIALHLASNLRRPENLKKSIINIDQIAEYTQLITTEITLGKILEKEFNEEKRFQEKLEKKIKDAIENKKESSLTREEKLIGVITSEAHMSSSEIWGPALACILVTSGECTVNTILHKINGLSAKLNRFYPTEQVNCPQFKDLELIRPCVQDIYDMSFEIVLKDTLHLGFILAYHQSSFKPQLRGILDFVSLESLRYWGMALVTLIDQVISYHQCPLSKLMKHYSYKTCISSWQSYYKVLFKYFCKTATYISSKNEEDADGDDYLWMYSRAFKDSVFYELSYNENKLLCQLLEYHRDITLKRDPKNIDTRPIYKSGKRHKQALLQEVFKADVRKVHETLDKEYKIRKKIEYQKAQEKKKELEEEKLKPPVQLDHLNFHDFLSLLK